MGGILHDLKSSARRIAIITLELGVRRGAEYGVSDKQLRSSAVKALGVSLGVWWPNARSSSFARLAKLFASFRTALELRRFAQRRGSHALAMGGVFEM